MFPSTSEPPSSASPYASSVSPPSPRTGLPTIPGQATCGDDYPRDRFDSDSGKHSSVSVALDRHLLYSADLDLQSSNEKSPRRAYSDYGITTSSYSDSSPTLSKFEDDRVIQTMPYSPLLPYAIPRTFPWELPSPSHARTTTLHSTHARDENFHTGSPSIYQSQCFWLVLYFCFNLSLTLYNKVVLIQFPYAYALTALHAFCGTIGGFALLRLGVYVPAKLTGSNNVALLAFSFLYTINIAVSNLSLELVTIPFHQVIRAATPLFTILLSMFLFGTRSSRQKIASLVPVVAGVGFATYGDYGFTTSGFLLTLLGTQLAAVKTLYTSVLQSSPSIQTPSTFRFLVPPRLQLHPLDLLTRMAPLAFVQCVILSYMTGELEQVRRWNARELTPWTAVALGLNGTIAFGLNIVSFTVNKKAGPLSMTVAANVKQVLSIILAVAIFNLSISPMNGLGIFLTLVGGSWYASVEFQEKRRAHNNQDICLPSLEGSPWAYAIFPLSVLRHPLRRLGKLFRP